MKKILIPSIVLVILIGGYIYFIPKNLDTRLDDLIKYSQRKEE